VATNAPYAIRRIFLVIIVLLLVPLNGSVAFFRLLPKAASFIITAVIGLVIAGALILRQCAANHAALLTFLLAAWNIISNIAVWPSLIIPLIVYAGVVILSPPLRRGAGWIRAGQFDRTLRALMLVTVFVSATGLLVWFILWKPDLTHFLSSIPSWNPALLVFEGIGFALLNAAMEASIFRGVLMQALDERLGPGMPSVILQAVAFGLLHIEGIPPATGSALSWQ
jgi:membrane protease YdiL (CAAX protease family)